LSNNDRYEANRPAVNQPQQQTQQPAPQSTPPAAASQPSPGRPAVNLPPANNRPPANPLQVNPPPPPVNRPQANPPVYIPPPTSTFPETPLCPPSPSLNGRPNETGSLPSANDLRVSANQAQSLQNAASASTVQPAPVRPEALQIIPGLPDRNSGKIYRLQVGAYSAQDTANKTAELMRAAGFQVQIENSASIYRVMAAGIASADVYSASVRLGSLGFGQIWVRE
jgi:hypothetical protein